MECSCADVCGCCCYGHLSETDYRDFKLAQLTRILERLSVQDYKLAPPIFIPEGTRRRVSFEFRYNRKTLHFGYHTEKSHDLVDIDFCCLLTPQINRILAPLKVLLQELCEQPYPVRNGKKQEIKHLTCGEVFICETDNGLDIVLEYAVDLDINARMIIAEFAQTNAAVVRISHRHKADESCETIIQKAIPFVTMGNYNIRIPAGTFLQASRQGEQALGSTVLKYLQGCRGNIADLFCGVGTFSYYILSQLSDVKLLSIDSGDDLLRGFQASVNANQISNITIKKQNLFKYPLTPDEISQFEAIVFDPPRAGAKELCRQIAATDKKPRVVVAISCNPLTFIHDADILLQAGYLLDEITFVDQFIYSPHNELVARFFLK